jgi:putative nucleotidyltransferase with HDIG domain
LISSNNIFFEKLSKDIKYTTPLIKTDNWVVAYAPYNLPHINFSSLYFLSITCFILVILTLITIYFLYLKNVEKPIKMTREKIEVFSKKYRINLKAKNSIEFLDNAFSTMITYLEKKNITLKKAFEKNTLLNDELEASNNQLKAQNDGLKDSFKKINVLSDKLESIVLIMSKNLINTTESFKVYFDTLLKYAIDLVPEASYGAVCFLNEDRYFDFISSIGHSLEELNKTKLIKRYELEKNKVYEIEFEDYPETVKKKLKPRTLSISSTIIVGIYDGDKLIGSLGIDSKQKIKFSEESKKILKALSNVASSYITFKNYIDLKEKFQERFISSIIYMLEKYDAYTKGHSQNVCDYALKIAKKLNLSEKEFETLKYSALLHDIGKMFIRHSILNKPDKLTKEEYEKMKQHSFYGYQVLSRSEELIDIGKIILHHHERYDGNGYPDKLSGNQIPLLSRIISVCDAYDTMVSKRIYKRSMTKQQALEELLNNSGTQFDPEIVEIFVGKVIGKALLL